MRQLASHKILEPFQRPDQKGSFYLPQKSKTEFLRGVREFNPSAYGTPGTAKEAARLKAKVDDYQAQSGGIWNYDNLYSTCISYLKGIPREQAEKFLASLDGPGEAKAKLSIFNALCKSIPFDQAQYVEDSRKTISFGERQATIAPDFSYKTDEGVFCVFVYPYKQPALKQNQRMAIVSTLASPPQSEPHFLQLVEYSEVSGQRSVEIETFEFAYRRMDEEFLLHMSGFYEVLDTSSGTGDLFG